MPQQDSGVAGKTAQRGRPAVIDSNARLVPRCIAPSPPKSTNFFSFGVGKRMQGTKNSAGRSLSWAAAVSGLIGLAVAFDASAGGYRWWHAPVTISGSPAKTDVIGKAYSFTPTASAPRGYTVTFSISGKPSWAAFNTSTGRLSGTPITAGTYSQIVIRATDGPSTAALAPFAITVAGSANTPPTISGTPTNAVNVGSAYSFTPTAADANQNPLSFSIQNKPSWATFSISNGQLSGTPSAAYAGTYANIVISVSDGTSNASLPAFSIAVNQTSNGTATVNWIPPQANTDGSVLANLAGYNIHYGTSSSSLNQTVKVSQAGLTSYTLTNLTAGTWYFGVSAYTTAGTESSISNVASKTIH
jgi:hypothetical protein